MKKLLSLMLFAVVFTGCSGGEKTTTICKGNMDENSTANVTIEATGDKTDVMKGKITYDLSEYISEELPIETYLSSIKSTNFDYNSLKGGKAKYSVDGNKIILEIEIDYNKADMDELTKAGLIESSDEDEKVVYISLEETIKEQEKAGLTCKEK